MILLSVFAAIFTTFCVTASVIISIGLFSTNKRYVRFIPG